MNLKVSMLDSTIYTTRGFLKTVNWDLKGVEESVLDVCEAVPDWQTDERANEAHAASVVDHICNAIPALIENIDKRFDRAGE